MNVDLLDGSLNIFNIFRVANYRHKFRKENPTYFNPEGLLVFCGSQGSRQNFVGCTVCKKSMSIIS